MSPRTIACECEDCSHIDPKDENDFITCGNPAVIEWRTLWGRFRVCEFCDSDHRPPPEFFPADQCQDCGSVQDVALRPDAQKHLCEICTGRFCARRARNRQAKVITDATVATDVLQRASFLLTAGGSKQEREHLAALLDVACRKAATDPCPSCGHRFDPQRQFEGGNQALCGECQRAKDPYLWRYFDGSTLLDHCTACHGELVALGGLGNIEHYRCRDCGLGHSANLNKPWRGATT